MLVLLYARGFDIPQKSMAMIRPQRVRGTLHVYTYVFEIFKLEVKVNLNLKLVSLSLVEFISQFTSTA